MNATEEMFKEVTGPVRKIQLSGRSEDEKKFCIKCKMFKLFEKIS